MYQWPNNRFTEEFWFKVTANCSCIFMWREARICCLSFNVHLPSMKWTIIGADVSWSDEVTCCVAAYHYMSLKEADLRYRGVVLEHYSRLLSGADSLDFIGQLVTT